MTGYDFVGWTQSTAAGDPGYNAVWGDAVYTTAQTVGLYDNVSVKPVWKVAADVVFVDYKYAHNGDPASGGQSNKMAVIAVKTDTGAAVNNSALYYGTNKLFTTTDTNYLGQIMNKAYKIITDSNASTGG